MAKIYSATIGFKIQITFNMDLTGYSVDYIVLKPDGSLVTYPTTIDNSTKGVTSYTTGSGDLALTGLYTIQPKLTHNSDVFYGDSVTFNVYPKVGD